MAMTYFNKTKQIKSITIKYSSLSEGFVRNIQDIIIDIAKKMRIDLNNPKDDRVTVYIYSSQMRSYFGKMFGGELSQREKYGAKAQMNVVKTGDGEIHILIGSGSNSNSSLKLVVSEIFGEFIDAKRVDSMKRATKEILDKRDKAEEEEELETEEEPEEEIEEFEGEPEEDNEEEPELEDAEVAEQIEGIIEKKEVVIPDWLEDGWYKYKKGYMTEARSTDLGEYLQTHKAGKVEKMNGKGSILKEYDREHELKCTKVEYIIETYGIKMLLRFFENPNVKEVFRISSKQFNDDWKQYLKIKYVNKTMEYMKIKEGSKENIDAKKQEKDKVIE